MEGFGKWVKLTKSFRYTTESPIIPLVESFQKSFLLQSYELDSDESFQLSLTSEGVEACGTFYKENLEQLARTIIQIAKENRIYPNDISLISSQDAVLRALDYVLRTSEFHKERTLCSFPSQEVVDHPKYSRSYDKISAAINRLQSE